MATDAPRCSLSVPSSIADHLVLYTPCTMTAPPFLRITHDPAVMGGRPCIRGLRVTVGTLVGLLAVGRSIEEVLAAYPYLDREDILAALAYAAWRAEEYELPLKAS